MLLLPISKIYGGVMAIRNAMFDKGILKQHEFDIPVVVVGNLTIGGAGKTPHTEYLIEHLRHTYKLGILSRGYKRRTKGFVLASSHSRPNDIGDESYQIFRKYGHDGVSVAVCENRVRGIEKLLEADPSINLILLDDAFQHRYVKPWVSMVLTEYSHPLYNDDLLPFGRLRESKSAVDRADVVIVTKCPSDIKPMEMRIFKENLSLYPYQKLLFSRYVYLPLRPLFPDQTVLAPIPNLSHLTSNDTILAVIGIANPRPFVRCLRQFGAKVKLKLFADHHNFTMADMEAIRSKFDAIKGDHKYIITTEKDAVRLAHNPYFPHQLRSKIFYLPIEVDFLLQNDESLVDIVNRLIRTKKAANR